VIGLRLKHGLNQAELAKRCGDDQAEIQRIETARP
jgi:transcriptional regulator with XRE-family HTH domain